MKKRKFRIVFEKITDSKCNYYIQFFGKEWNTECMIKSENDLVNDAILWKMNDLVNLGYQFDGVIHSTEIQDFQSWD